MDKLDTMKLFLRIAEAGSFSKAARELGIVQSTASKQLAALEKRLGAQLVRRTSRGLALTAAGKHYYDEALRLVGEIEALDDDVSARERSPSGLVRVTCPPGFAALLLLPELGAFVARYPKLFVDFVVSQHNVDIVAERVDIAIRVGELQDSDLRSRRLGTTTAIVVASAKYLDEHGEPKSPADLEHHACIASVNRGRPRAWPFGRGAGAVLVHPKGPVQSDDSELTRAAVKSGLGVAYAASWLFREELASGAVRQVLKGYACAEAPVHAVWSGGRALSRRAGVFVDFVAKICAREPTLRLR